MSLDILKLKKVRKQAGGKITAQCPACAEQRHDRAGNHLVVYPDGKFACVVNEGDGGATHRKQIFELVGLRQPEFSARHLFNSTGVNDAASLVNPLPSPLPDQRRSIKASLLAASFSPTPGAQATRPSTSKNLGTLGTLFSGSNATREGDKSSSTCIPIYSECVQTCVLTVPDDFDYWEANDDDDEHDGDWDDEDQPEPDPSDLIIEEFEHA